MKLIHLTYKLLFTLIFVMFINQSVIANSNKEEAKIAVVKALYSFSLENDVSIQQNTLFTADLENVFEEDATCAAKEEGICVIDYDVFIQGQDYDQNEIKHTLTYQTEPDGKVKVNFINFNTPITLYYVMKCEDNLCLIDDILESDWNNPPRYISFKKKVREALKEMKSTQK